MVTIRLDFAARLGSAVRLRSAVLVPIALAAGLRPSSLRRLPLRTPDNSQAALERRGTCCDPLADFNGDGNLDIIVLCVSETADGSQVALTSSRKRGRHLSIAC